MRSYRLVCTLVLGLALAGASSAQVPPQAGAVQPEVLPVEQQATREQLARYFEVLRARETLASILKMAAKASKPQIDKSVDDLLATTPVLNQMTAQEKDQYRQIMYKFAEQSSSVIDMDLYLQDSIEVNQKYLSRSDVDALIAFYSSPAGQHFLNQQPAVLSELMQRSMPRISTRVKDLSDQESKDLQALIAAAQAAQSSAQAGAKHATLAECLGKLVNSLADAYVPGQSFSKTLTKVVADAASTQP